MLAMAISGAFAGLAGAMDMLGWQFRLGVLDVQVSLRSASSGSPSRCSAATRPSASSSARCSSGRSCTGTSTRAAISNVDQARARGQPDADHPGPRRALRRRRRADPLPVELAAEARGCDSGRPRRRRPHEHPGTAARDPLRARLRDPSRGCAGSCSARSRSGSCCRRSRRARSPWPIIVGVIAAVAAASGRCRTAGRGSAGAPSPPA